MKALLVSALLLPSLGATVLAQPPEIDKKIGGQHWRLETSKGALHLWRPKNYRHHNAGVVVYLHGYFIDVDAACRDPALPAQFAASLQNAVFISAESPKSDEEAVTWFDLEQLLETAFSDAKIRRPQGPLVAIGHSGAYRTIVCWLEHPQLDTIILLDGLYSLGMEYFLSWLEADARHRLILVSDETHANAVALAGRFSKAVLREDVPEKFRLFTSEEFREQLVIIHSQYKHLEMVSEGRVLPLVLRLGPLPTVPGTKK